MKSSTVQTLNQLNQNFYRQVFQSFDQTRQTAWHGWQSLVPFIAQLPSPCRVLDLGCGNGRFAQFLQSQQIPMIYQGLDSSLELLSLAQKSLPKSAAINLAPLDLIQTLCHLPDSTPWYFKQKYDMVVAFGLLHHIPSYQLRERLIQLMTRLLGSNRSLAVVSAWQFTTDDRFKNKLISPTMIGVDPHELESDDCLLGWQDRPNIYRYCHHFSQDEMLKIITQLNDVQLSHQYFADGKSGKLNQYYILKKA